MTRFKTLWNNLGPVRTIHIAIVCTLLFAASGFLAWHGQTGSPILLFPAMFALTWVWRDRLVQNAEFFSKLISYGWFVVVIAVVVLRKYSNSTPWAVYAMFGSAGLYAALVWTLYSDPRIITERRLRA